MESLKFIEKPLKALKTFCPLSKRLEGASWTSKGERKELHFSKGFHQKGIPLLIDPQFLRLNRAGQVDLARISFGKKGNYINIYEIKSSRRISKKQIKRLYDSCTLLGEILNLPCFLKVVI